ncbi:hypothetical protein NDU88_001269 [Pleurodeles waltl]|uniref:Uncharacterized protein n=1 Tax=Pleurodeles waltl TaxID=8319 RepID=A0AAV7R8J9_PLEWA|nr:hypothetical protein NDU88_001269 [Pleurodeles waltl]
MEHFCSRCPLDFSAARLRRKKAAGASRPGAAVPPTAGQGRTPSEFSSPTGTGTSPAPITVHTAAPQSSSRRIGTSHWGSPHSPSARAPARGERLFPFLSSSGAAVVDYFLLYGSTKAQLRRTIVHLGQRQPNLNAGRLSRRSEGPRSSPHSAGPLHLRDQGGGRRTQSPPPQFTGGHTLAPRVSDSLLRPREAKTTLRPPGSRHTPDSVPPQPTVAAGTCSASRNVSPSGLLVLAPSTSPLRAAGAPSRHARRPLTRAGPESPAWRPSGTSERLSGRSFHHLRLPGAP